MRTFALGPLFATLMDVTLRIMVLERCMCEDSAGDGSSCGITRTVTALARLDLVAILVQVSLTLNGEFAG
jgi:hypothetical protein